MDFLDKLYSNDSFGIGLFAVIAFLVVTFLVVLFFGKKDAKKRKLENDQTTNSLTTDTFKEVSTPTPVEIPVNPQPVEPIKLEPSFDVTNQVEAIEPVKPNPIEDNNSLPPIEPVEPIIPVATFQPELPKEEYTSNIVKEDTIEEKIPEIKPIVIPEAPKKETVIEPTSMETTKIEIPSESIVSIMDKIEVPVIEEIEEKRPVEPVIKEEEPVLQISEEPEINTYYKPIEKSETETIKVPTIDYDSLAKSIAQELDALEGSRKKYDEVKITPMSEVQSPSSSQNSAFSSVYIKNTASSKTTKETLDLPKKIDLPARKS